MASYRAGNRRETDESGPRRRPWQTLKSPPPNNRSQEGRRIGAIRLMRPPLRTSLRRRRNNTPCSQTNSSSNRYQHLSLTVQSITGGGNPPGNPFCSTRHFFSAHIFLFFFLFGFRAVAPFSLLSNGAIFNTFSLLIKCDGCIMERDVTFFSQLFLVAA